MPLAQPAALDWQAQYPQHFDGSVPGPTNFNGAPSVPVLFSPVPTNFGLDGHEPYNLQHDMNHGYNLLQNLGHSYTEGEHSGSMARKKDDDEEQDKHSHGHRDSHQNLKKWHHQCRGRWSDDLTKVFNNLWSWCWLQWLVLIVFSLWLMYCVILIQHLMEDLLPYVLTYFLHKNYTFFQIMQQTTHRVFISLRILIISLRLHSLLP